MDAAAALGDGGDKQVEALHESQMDETFFDGLPEMPDEMPNLTSPCVFCDRSTEDRLFSSVSTKGFRISPRIFLSRLSAQNRLPESQQTRLPE